jgi:hypothetical protein
MKKPRRNLKEAKRLLTQVHDESVRCCQFGLATCWTEVSFGRIGARLRFGKPIMHPRKPITLVG